jgi:hypothetical protein
VVNLVMYGKGVWCSEEFCRSGKIFGPLNGTLTEIFLATGGVAEINLFHKQFFRDWSGTIRKRQISFRPPNFFLPVRPWV